MKRLLLIAATIALLVPHLATAAGPAPVRTLFGHGAELHLYPSFAQVGAHVLAVGIGYRPGGTVAVEYGGPMGKFLTGPAVRVRVRSDGTFRARFTVTCAFATLHVPAAPRCAYAESYLPRPLIVGAFEGGRYPAKSAMETAFIVMPQREWINTGRPLPGALPRDTGR